jgi:hypothetical protein
VASGSVIARILTQYSDKGSKAAQRDINKLGKQFSDFGKRAAKAFAVAGIAAAAFAVKIGKDAVQAAMEDQKSQLLLANALRNTVGATDANIAATEAYISAMQRQFAIADDDLRPSLAALAAVTGDLAQAQSLQNIAVDVAAGTGKDLSSVTQAIIKAYQGNLGALRRLGVPLEENIVKSKDFNAAMQALSTTFAGAGTTSANTFAGKLRNLQLTYSDIIEQLGYALIPVLENLASFITATILPALEAWITANKDQVASSLQAIIDNSIKAGKAIFKFFKVIKDNFQTVKNLAAILTGLFVAGKVYAGIVAITAAITTLRIAFGLQAAAAGTAAIATAAATGGANLVAGAAAIVAFTAATGVALVALNGTSKATKEVANQTDKLAAIERANAKERGMLASRNLQTIKTTVTTTNAVVTAAKKLTAEEKKRLEVKKAIKKAGLDEFGIRNVSMTDPISLEAARLNLVKEGSIAELKRFDLMMAFNREQARLNDLTQRYADILAVVADSRVSDEEVALLAAKWGISTAAVIEYIAKVTNAPLPAGWNTPGDNAATGWQSALAALNAYYAALGVTPKVNVPGSVVIPKQDPNPVITPEIGSLLGMTADPDRSSSGFTLTELQIFEQAMRAASSPSFSMMADTGDDIFNRNRTTGQLTINVTGTGGLSDETKREVVNAVVEASGSGYSTNWFRTTGGGEGILFT